MDHNGPETVQWERNNSIKQPNSKQTKLTDEVTKKINPDCDSFQFLKMKSRLHHATKKHPSTTNEGCRKVTHASEEGFLKSVMCSIILFGFFFFLIIIYYFSLITWN